MAKATTVSLAKFTASVHSAVKEAVAKHPKFKLEVPQGISVSYLIRGFPIPDGILSQVSISEVQAFTADVAAGISKAHSDLVTPDASQGAFVSLGRHIICGIPPFRDIVQLGP